VSFDVLLTSTSFLEFAFLRWVLTPAARLDLASRVTPQASVTVNDHTYSVDYEVAGTNGPIAIELDGFEFHGTRLAFTYDRFRQNDLEASGRRIVRFSYDAIRQDTARCVAQLQAMLRTDPGLAQFIIADPAIESPAMDPDPLHSLAPSPREAAQDDGSSYFDRARSKLNLSTLRLCQREAFAALANYFGSGGRSAACVMSVGAGKTALGVAATLSFARRRALVVTPGNVIKGTFDRSFNAQVVGNALNGLPSGPLIPGLRPPRVLTLDADHGAVGAVTREQLLAADVLISNFHSLGDGSQPGDLLAKLGPDDVDMLIIDEAHIAAADSYQRLFHHFNNARTLLMSACFQRLDGKPIDADVVYRYRLIDSIADGNAKNLRIHRFAPTPEVTAYEVHWPNGGCEEVIGRDALLEIITDERRLALVTAKSHEPIRQVMRLTKRLLDAQSELLAPVKPRALFSALGQLHAEQIADIAEHEGIRCGVLHHSQPAAQIASTRERFESDAGDLQAIVQLKMLGQGYDFPPICVIVPMRPYRSFAEFYQFVGRGIRVIQDPAVRGRVAPDQQYLDLAYHSELGLDEHIEEIYLENDMDPLTAPISDVEVVEVSDGDTSGTGVDQPEEQPEAFVVFEQGAIETRFIHDADRVERRRDERERDALAQRYAEYAATNPAPVSFEEFAEVVRKFRG
jgi:superfamily II DNA or RNA helicase/very-short-patch-repair endonuclease